MINKIKNLVINEEGQGMTEYGLVLGAIGIGAVATLVLLRGEIMALLNDIITGIGASSDSVRTAP